MPEEERTKKARLLSTRNKLNRRDVPMRLNYATVPRYNNSTMSIAKIAGTRSWTCKDRARNFTRKLSGRKPEKDLVSATAEKNEAPTEDKE